MHINPQMASNDTGVQFGSIFKSSVSQSVPADFTVQSKALTSSISGYFSTGVGSYTNLGFIYGGILPTQLSD